MKKEVGDVIEGRIDPAMPVFAQSSAMAVLHSIKVAAAIQSTR
jgi:hypothetical protein